MLSELKIADFLICLAPEVWKARRCPSWPADAFGCVAALLERSGAYTKLGTNLWPKNHPRWCEEMNRLADRWRSAWYNYSPNGRSPAVPAAIQQRWQDLVACAETTVGRIGENESLCRTLLDLLAICDNTFRGAGLRTFEGILEKPKLTQKEKQLLAFSMQVELRLAGLMDHHAGRSHPKISVESTLCDTISPSRLRVLPKSQTPRSGLSLRSLTHHISFCPPTNTSVRWLGFGVAPDSVGEESCNFLLVPWPFEIREQDFAEVSRDRERRVGWFGYRPSHRRVGQIVDVVEQLVKQVNHQVGPVHAVVLPELALTTEQYGLLAQFLVPRGIGLISGVAWTPPEAVKTDRRAPPTEPWCRNYAALTFPAATYSPERITIEQQKHHRWRLDTSQIVRYGISNQLDPTLEWWEGIQVDKRSLNFVVLREWLSTCVLVCEDLARIDPIGRYVRAVGPDLVIALLMDGPQLRDRWPAYHATVLTDDPGSSVLTLTSLGMVKASRPIEMIGQTHRRTIALWRDSTRGVVEIDLPEAYHGALLTLNKQKVLSRTADGRVKSDFGAPMFGGLKFLKANVVD